MMTKLLRLIVGLIFLFNLSSCALLNELDLKEEPVLPPAYPVDNPPPPKTNGTIYQAGHEIQLYQDHVANRIGDILTVRLEEQTQGEKLAKTKANKTNTDNTNNGIQNAPGMLVKPYLLGGTMNSLIFNTGTDLEFDGKGETHEQNKLHGTISVTVTRVLSNGNLVVQGESWITINTGREYVRLAGIVRSEDIEPPNTVSSQRIADARISYSGGGMVNNASKGGLLTQILFKFFPY